MGIVPAPRLEQRVGFNPPAAQLAPSYIDTLALPATADGPFGAKEVGEGPIVVTMAAVANAVANAVGEMLPQIPMTPWRLLRVIRHRRNHGLAPAD